MLEAAKEWVKKGLQKQTRIVFSGMKDQRGKLFLQEDNSPVQALFLNSLMLQKLQALFNQRWEEH